MTWTPEELKAAEVEWTHRVFAEIDEMDEQGVVPNRVDAEWLAGRKLQCEINSLLSHACGEKGAQTNGAELIAAERTRQIADEGWTPQHDDEHVDCQLGLAARAYIHVARCQVTLYVNVEEFHLIPNDWPVDWLRETFKSSDDPVRNLVKAGALIAAEIDRLQRLQSQAMTRG